MVFFDPLYLGNPSAIAMPSPKKDVVAQFFKEIHSRCKLTPYEQVKGKEYFDALTLEQILAFAKENVFSIDLSPEGFDFFAAPLNHWLKELSSEKARCLLEGYLGHEKAQEKFFLWSISIVHGIALSAGDCTPKVIVLVREIDASILKKEPEGAFLSRLNNVALSLSIWKNSWAFFLDARTHFPYWPEIK